MNFDDCPKALSDDEIRKVYKLLEKQIKEESDKEKYSNDPSCSRCVYGDKCPVYWHFGNAACITIFKNKFIK